MTKKILTLACLLGFALIGRAQTDSHIDAADIQFWVGEGSATAIFNLECDDTSLAWGYRFDEDDAPTVQEMISSIDRADPRLSYGADWDTYEYTFFYREYPLYIACSGFNFKVDDVLADEDDEFADYDLEDGTYVKVSNSTATNWTLPVVAATYVDMPTNSTINASEVTYWVGTGSNRAVVVINWGVPDTALAWGLQFDGTINVRDALNAVVSADPRLTSNYLANFDFDLENGDSLIWNAEGRTDNYMQFILDGNSQAGFTSTVADGSLIKVGESAYGQGVDTSCSSYGCFPLAVYWSTPIHPVSAPGTQQDTTIAIEDARIAAADILYWLGEGENEVVMTFNWPDTALAWGYRFGTDSVTVSEIIATIDSADSRFKYEGSLSYFTDFLFADSTTADTLRITPHDPSSMSIYWNLSVNSVSSMLGANMKKVGNGDFVRYADTYVAVKADSSWVEDWGGYWDYSLVWPQTIYPVSAPVDPQDTNTNAIDMVSGLSVAVYPNPASSHITVALGGVQNANTAIIYDMSGREVLRKAISTNANAIELNVSALPEGIYMLRIGHEVVKVAITR